MSLRLLNHQAASTALHWLKALASIAALCVPLVKFDTELNYATGLGLLPYTITEGAQPMLFSASPFPWQGWLAAIAMAILITAVAFIIYDNIVNHRDRPVPNAVALVAVVLYPVLAMPYLDAVHYAGWIAPVVVYGMEPARPLLLHAAKHVAPRVTRRLRAARAAMHDDTR